MPIPTIGLIVPTCGRRSLQTTIRSAQPQLGPGDRLLVVGDGPQRGAELLCRRRGLEYIQTEPTGWYGNHQMNVGLDTLGTSVDLLLQLDDDDTLRPDALTNIRLVGKAHPGAILMFRMKTPAGVLWTHESVAPGNVGSGNFVFPSGNPARFNGPDVPDPGHSDFQFIKAYQAHHAGGLVWVDAIIYNVPKRGLGRAPAHP